MELQAVLVKLGVGIGFSIAATFLYPYINCVDVNYGSEDYHSNIEKLAAQAKLPDNYYNRYHHSAVSDLYN